MKIFVLNGPKTARTLFAILCISVILYLGFFSDLRAIAVSSKNAQTTYVVVIVDDFGNDTDGTKEFMYSDIDFTGAVMPSMPHSMDESIRLNENGKDVILHMPMEAHTAHDDWLPELALRNETTPEKAKEILEKSLLEIDYCIGINNHMGSKVMENEGIVRAILEVAKEKDLIFIDSLTTENSKASKIAEEMGITIIKRDIFLDSTKDMAKIEANFKKAGEISKKKGYAVAIGHVGQAGGKPTIQAMKNIKPYFDEQNIEFITLSEFLEIRNDIDFGKIK